MTALLPLPEASPPAVPPAPVGDHLVSYCFASEGEVAADLHAIAAFAATCADRVRYWEILYIVSEQQRGGVAASAALVTANKGLRILLVQPDTSYYRRRAIAAAEAIGDVVVLCSLGELAAVDPIALGEEAWAGNIILQARKGGRPGWPGLVQPLLAMISQYRVSAADLRSIALPRAALVEILGRPTAAIDLRFEPRSAPRRYARKPVASIPPRRGLSSDGRLAFLAEIVSASAPRFLRAYAAVSAGVFVAAFAYAVYVVIVMLTFTAVQPGWFTTNIVQSGSVGFLALGFVVFSLGLARLIELGAAGPAQGIVDEIGSVSFFDRAPDLNVEAQG